MKESNTEQLIKKYKEGYSTLLEEKKLFNSAKNLSFPLSAWTTFVNKNRKEVPKTFNENLWKSFQGKKRKKHNTLTISIVSLAATVLLLISLNVTQINQETKHTFESNELLNLITNIASNLSVSESHHTIIYQDEIIVIYTTK